jgi:hypothetical protein
MGRNTFLQMVNRMAIAMAITTAWFLETMSFVVFVQGNMEDFAPVGF